MARKQNNINKNIKLLTLNQNYLIDKKENSLNISIKDIFKRNENILINENNKINFWNENLKSKDDLMKNNDLIKIELEKTKRENQVLIQRNTENENQYNQLKTSLEEKGKEIKKLNEINKNLEEKNKYSENIMNKANEKLIRIKIKK